MFSFMNLDRQFSKKIAFEGIAVLTCAAAYVLFAQNAYTDQTSIFSSLSLLQVIELAGLAAVVFVAAMMSWRRASRDQASCAMPLSNDGIEQAEIELADRLVTDTTRYYGLSEGAGDAEQRFSLILKTFDIATFYCDREHRYVWSHNFMGNPDDLLGKRDEEILPKDSAAILLRLKQKALNDGGMHSGEINIDLGHDVKTYSVQVAPRRDSFGHIIGTLAVSCDVTEKALWQKHLMMMMREVNHRARNVMAIIASICGQTATTAATTKEYQEKITSRVMSLAASVDLITRDHWGSSSLKKLITTQFTLLNRGETHRIRVTGEDVLINASAVQNIGLAVHELALNARQHGALSDPEGQVDLEISTQDHSGKPGLILTWTERSEINTGCPEHRGFGLMALEAVLASELGGSSKLYWEKTGLRCVLTLPGTVHGNSGSNVACRMFASGQSPTLKSYGAL